MGANVSVRENIDLLLEAYDYELPPERIAQNPVEPRDSARLLVANSPASHNHRIFRELPDLLAPGDLLVLNDTRTIPARLYGNKPSGAAVEVLLLNERSPDTWLALVKPGKRLQPGAQIVFSAESDSPGADSVATLTATVLAREDATGGRILQFDVPPGTALVQLLDRFGCVPLPPYITDSKAPPERYQTVYAEHPGSAAAPTAGLHFTDELLGRLDARGIDRAFVTLHVGVGTFRPVKAAEITHHQMHGEWVEVGKETVEKIRQTQARGRRVIAVGTTVVRSLESAARGGTLQPFCGQTDLFIYPGYQWQVVDGLITNFHLPRSSLLMLVSAMVGRERLLELYREAIELEYRFFSFGDAMLLGNFAQRSPAI
ncbi:tRNA preQ1(34) S-adenosylmethionine ribosyltransferase-isomerase QueA [Oscillatoriales cyanobacterium LEGE 11467]|uniref:S-adenosylmethionine:tRNA ribosyltransferase-isomerase n=1 Tax=Zarconia navalis LEGE 11467 TaxID=1828826 RepID=A0A928Z7B4_9CYAN|nr:tRNA preQ1(34) S-adenosylmethionine ribosyltransferase-isomerase QueA [Zarconia navalis]MBE9039503.1 tRNA preQ1(34) S-adenosylmethionine ribosyltransferase-isomerase QueA [Zarconia navalis LEGE 11467]